MPVAGELVEATREGADYLVHRFTLIKSKKACTVMDASLFCSNENIRKWISVYNTAAIRLLLRRCGAVHAGAMISSPRAVLIVERQNDGDSLYAINPCAHWGISSVYRLIISPSAKRKRMRASCPSIELS